jgi:predicted AlkP superfamily pyrophosphatase or phosphodiesterase
MVVLSYNPIFLQLLNDVFDLAIPSTTSNQNAGKSREIRFTTKAAFSNLIAGFGRPSGAYCIKVQKRSGTYIDKIVKLGDGYLFYLCINPLEFISLLKL